MSTKAFRALVLFYFYQDGDLSVVEIGNRKVYRTVVRANGANQISFIPYFREINKEVNYGG